MKNTLVHVHSLLYRSGGGVNSVPSLRGGADPTRSERLKQVEPLTPPSLPHAKSHKLSLLLFPIPEKLKGGTKIVEKKALEDAHYFVIRPFNFLNMIASH